MMARRAYSLYAGTMSQDGSNTSWPGALSSMKAVDSSRGDMPLASPAAMKPPADTPM